MGCWLPRLLLLLTAAVLAGCGERDFSDLDAFMEEKRARPGGVIAPIPTFKAYEAFTYSATAQRSPFSRPVAVREITEMQATSTVRPDESRPKEFLEQFTFDSLSLVGSLKRGGNEWALIRDPEGGVHRVSVGNYLGRSHGRIVEVADTYIAVIEIVPSGAQDGWVERPRTLKLQGL